MCNNMDESQIMINERSYTKKVQAVIHFIQKFRKLNYSIMIKSRLVVYEG